MDRVKQVLAILVVGAVLVLIVGALAQGDDGIRDPEPHSGRF